MSQDPLGDVLAGDCLLGLVRLPDARMTEELHTVFLYEEEPGVAVPRESIYAQLGEQSIRVEDLSDEIVNYRIADSGEVDIPRVREALRIVAANVGVCIAPRPLLRALSKKRVTALGLEDSRYRVTQVALVWKKQQDSETIQDFVGIAKGRTPSSSRHSMSSQAHGSTSTREPARPGSSVAARSQNSASEKGARRASGRNKFRGGTGQNPSGARRRGHRGRRRGGR